MEHGGDGAGGQWSTKEWWEWFEGVWKKDKDNDAHLKGGRQEEATNEWSKDHGWGTNDWGINSNKSNILNNNALSSTNFITNNVESGSNNAESGSSNAGVDADGNEPIDGFGNIYVDLVGKQDKSGLVVGESGDTSNNNYANPTNACIIVGEGDKTQGQAQKDDETCPAALQVVDTKNEEQREPVVEFQDFDELVPGRSYAVGLDWEGPTKEFLEEAGAKKETFLELKMGSLVDFHYLEKGWAMGTTNLNENERISGWFPPTYVYAPDMPEAS